MPRLNYTNRKSEGLKLGQIVAKDLRKRAKSFSAKNEKQHEGTSLELDVSGKKIDDEGFFEIFSALEEMARENGSGSCSKIEELNFSQNIMTTKSLAQLASVIRAAQYDLQVLDLSYNKIIVQTSEAARDWETFLESFSRCYRLRRLDLSGNDLSGPRAFEILTRVYGRQMPADPADLKTMSASVISVPETDSTSMLDRTKALSVVDAEMDSDRSPRRTSSPKPSLSQGTILSRQCGLRAVPYLVIRDVSLTNTGALFLSYLLALHYFPDQLMTGLRAAPAESKREEYSQDFAGGKGIIYLPSDLLTRCGTEVLESAEVSRTALLGSDDSDLSIDQVPELNSLSTGRRFSSASPHRRRVSAFSMHSSEDTGQGFSDLESRRHKAQRTTIEESGVHCVELWSVSLEMLVKARAVLVGTTPRIDSPMSTTGPDIPNTPLRRVSNASMTSPSPPVAPHNTPIHSYASTLTVGSSSSTTDPNLAITDTTNTKSPSKSFNLKFVHPRRSSSSSKPSQHSGLSTEITYADEPTKRTGTREAYINVQKQRMEDTAVQHRTDGYRDKQLPGGLSLQLWRDILVDATGAWMLSREQQVSVVGWAQDAATLAEESKNLGKPKSSQIWKVLDGMGCLAYDIRL